MYQNPSVETSERTLFLGNIPPDFTEKLLFENFKVFGSIEWIDFQANSRSSPLEEQSFYANIVFQTRESAEAAYQFANGKCLSGRKLT